MSKLDLITDSEEYHIFWFRHGKSSNIKFWSRLGGQPDLSGLTVLDVGCGQGSLCLDMATAKAKKVIGIDLNSPAIDFASRNLRENYPEWQSVVSFECRELSTLPSDTFDIVVSKDAFEHVLDLRGLLENIKRCLKPGGRLFAGFGPLYNSPSGHHTRPNYGLPWGHLLIPVAWQLFLINRGRKEKVKSLSEIDALNELAFADYLSIFNESGLDIISMRVNQSDHLASRIITLFRNVPFLREYCTHNIYCVTEKR